MRKVWSAVFAGGVLVAALAWAFAPRALQLQLAGIGALHSPHASSAPASADPVSRPALSGSVPLHVVGLGDSVPAATTEDLSDSYVTLVADGLASRAGRPARVDNLAIPGLTSVGLLGQLSEDAVRETLAQADVVIVTVGANDLDPGELVDQAAEAASVSDVRDVLTLIVSGIHTAAPQAEIVLTGYWNVFLAGEVAAEQGPDYVSGSDALTRQFNAMVQSVAAESAARYGDIYTPFLAVDDETSLLAADGDHPNALGHEVIARALLDQI